jgi:hypothetical protein
VVCEYPGAVAQDLARVEDGLCAVLEGRLGVEAEAVLERVLLRAVTRARRDRAGVPEALRRWGGEITLVSGVITASFGSRGYSQGSPNSTQVSVPYTESLIPNRVCTWARGPRGVRGVARVGSLAPRGTHSVLYALTWCYIHLRSRCGIQTQAQAKCVPGHWVLGQHAAWPEWAALLLEEVARAGVRVQHRQLAAEHHHCTHREQNTGRVRSSASWLMS